MLELKLNWKVYICIILIVIVGEFRVGKFKFEMKICK